MLKGIGVPLCIFSLEYLPLLFEGEGFSLKGIKGVR
jgi:hypothetical protein